MKIDWADPQIQEIELREPKLCCWIDPVFKCSGCGASICAACQEVDYNRCEDDVVDINLVGHRKIDCFFAEEPGYNWMTYREWTS